MLIESREHLETIRKELVAKAASHKDQILVCCGTGCLANGAQKVAEKFAAEVQKRNMDAQVKLMVKKTGCHGFCERGPLVALQPSGILYTRVRVANVEKILDQTVAKGEVIERLLYKDPVDDVAIEQYSEIPFYKNQTRVAMRNIGLIDPTEIEDAIAVGCYQGAARALLDMTPEKVLDDVETSGLRGRGGAGFNTARKWRSCRKAPGERRFVLCNGDEGDPGAFKDRSIMEGDPHSIIEGMIVGAYAVGAHEGFIYVRDEYPLAVVNLTLALAQARTMGLLGENILGSGFDFDLKLSLAGKVGEPRAKYVHSTEKGLFDLPTVLNNVETWSDVGAIALNGGEWFAGMGTAKSKGTKAFSLVGKVKNTGLIELPMGGGGVLDDRPFKAVQTGGPSGGCIPEALLDLPVDYEKLTEAGSMMGSGGMIVMDDRTCMVDVARYFLGFLCEESCGKCTPCREGLVQMLKVYDRLVEGEGLPSDLALIERLSAGMQLGSLCELGKSAPNPVVSTLRYFRDEYVAHIEDHVCVAGVCKALTAYRILEESCDGCAACAKACPVDSITGERHAVHIINHETCISCGACLGVCPTDSVQTFPKVELQKEVV